ncbi:MAG: iron-containing alcohol dehydrogenase [Desulfobacterales bacterium]|nr:iron-containing alcohol dehydrogenase [Desulfobacterales bacterium]
MIFDPAIVATEAIVDPELTYSYGRHVSLVSGLDTMTHLIEGYLNIVDEGVDPEANDRAIAGMKLLLDALPRVIGNREDREARRMMSMASTLGGTVLFYKQAGVLTSTPSVGVTSWTTERHALSCCRTTLPIMLPWSWKN